MSKWDSGYVSDIAYTYGYYLELNPLRSQLALLHSGSICPKFETACELGFGQGLSTNFHATASTTEWYGTDFNPSQASFAQHLNSVSQAGAKLYDEAFEEFCNRSDLPEFDFIGLHGIWSWISDKNRKILVDFIGKKLKVGGVLYVSYNTLPGWAAFLPMQHLMTEHANRMSAPSQNIQDRVGSAIEFADNLLNTSPVYSIKNPTVKDRIEKLKGMSKAYLAHEYFNRDWHPMHFGSFSKLIEPAKVQFACSASYLEHIDVVNLTKEQQEFMNSVPDPMFKQSIRDFMVDQQFRKDYWVKGIRQYSALEKSELFKSHEIILQSARTDIPKKVNGTLGEATLTPEVYEPILDVLGNHKPISIGQLLEKVKDKNIDLAKLAQAVMILASDARVNSVQDSKESKTVKPQTSRLNNYIIERSRSRSDINFLISPLTATGISADRLEQLFLLAYKEGRKQPQEWVPYVWHVLKSQGQSILKEGKSIESEEDNIKELGERATKFASERLSLFKALDIIDG